MPGPDLPPFIALSREVAGALEEGRPVVALESAVISHGLPHPTGLGTAEAIEADIRGGGAVPATVAVVQGRVIIGASADELARLTQPQSWKIGERDLAPAVAARATGGTTVAATVALAALAGIRVMSTGGIGGVHLGAETTWDVSADLIALGRHSLVAVCAGAKAVCDIGKTLEYLDTAGVTVAAYGTDRFPGFYTVDSGHPAPRRIERPGDAVAILLLKRRLRQSGAVLIANPIPEAASLPAAVVEQAVRQAISRTGRVRGSDLTPALLATLGEITGGKTLRANLALLRSNAQLAAAIAREAAQESLRG